MKKKKEFQLFNEFEAVKKNLSCLSTNTNAGMDQFSTKFLKEVAGVLAYPFSKIINLSIKLSAFPEECKIAKLKPLFKKGSKTSRKCHRPISLLPPASKVIGEPMHYQLQGYLKENFLLNQYESGCRTNFL